MFRLTCDIKIDRYRFKGVTDLSIESSWDNLTGTCSITLPRRLSWQGQPLATGNDPLLKKGMEVSVAIGYDDTNVEVFTGFISQISATIPLKIECEDQMWLLKQSSFTGSYPSVKSGDLISDMLENAGLNNPLRVDANWDLGQFRISNTSPVKVLDKLKSEFFIKSWWRDGTLHTGLAYVAAQQRTRVIKFNKHVKPDSSLEYRRKEDVRIGLKGLIIKPDNSREEIEVGEMDGDIRTFHYYNLSKADAENRLKEELSRLVYDGYRGSFSTFGRPEIRHGDMLKLIDPDYPERDGNYLVKKVQINFGTSGYNQTIELESKV